MPDVFDPSNLTAEQVPGLTDQQLNDAAAQLVMGYRAHLSEKQAIVGYYWLRLAFESQDWRFASLHDDFSPSTDLNHAAMLTERMRKRGWRFELLDDDAWCAQLYSHTGHMVESPSLLSRARAETEVNVLAALWERGQGK